MLIKRTDIAEGFVSRYCHNMTRSVIRKPRLPYVSSIESHPGGAKAEATVHIPGAPKRGEKVHYLQFSFPDITNLPATSSIEAALRVLDKRFKRPQQTFGLDHRVQFSLEQETESAPSRKPFYRLSQEPLILSHWNRISEYGLSTSEAAKFVSLLCSKQVINRNYTMWARGPAGHFVYFESIAASKNWMIDLSKIKALCLPPLLEAILVYCRIVIAHPFSDGNGRFARSMFYGPLARAEILASPCLALGAVLNTKREELAKATIGISEKGGWHNYVMTMISAIELSIDRAIHEA